MINVRECSMLLATASLFVIPAPSFAAIDTDFGTRPVADAACNAALNPNDNSDFTTYALDDGTSTPGASVTTDNGDAVLSGYGTSSTVHSNFEAPRQNGQSVNIHALAKLSITFAQTLATIPTKTVTETIVQVGCHTHKPFQNGGNDNDPHQLGGETVKYNAPNGQQSHTASYTTSVTTYGTRTEIRNVPFYENPTSKGQVVICISPGSRPGQWRFANNYNGQLGTCAAMWTQILASTPSVSVPSN